jgi:gas vesicle protein
MGKVSQCETFYNGINAKKLISDTKNELRNIIDKNKETIQENSQEILNKLLYGEGLKVIKNSKRKR